MTDVLAAGRELLDKIVGMTCILQQRDFNDITKCTDSNPSWSILASKGWDDDNICPSQNISDESKTSLSLLHLRKPPNWLAAQSMGSRCSVPSVFEPVLVQHSNVLYFQLFSNYYILCAEFCRCSEKSTRISGLLWISRRLPRCLLRIWGSIPMLLFWSRYVC